MIQVKDLLFIHSRVKENFLGLNWLEGNVMPACVK